MGLLKALGRNGMRALQTGHMFSVPGAERGLTRPVMQGVANRVAGGAEVSPDIELARQIAQKMQAGQPLTVLEREIFDEMLIKVRDQKARQMLTGSREPTPYDELFE